MHRWWLYNPSVSEPTRFDLCEPHGISRDLHICGGPWRVCAYVGDYGDPRPTALGDKEPYRDPNERVTPEGEYQWWYLPPDMPGDLPGGAWMPVKPTPKRGGPAAAVTELSEELNELSLALSI